MSRAPRPVASRALDGLWAPLLALLSAMAVASALILGCGQSPWSVYRLLLDGTWGNPYGLGQVLFKATPLAFTGLAVAVPLRAGLFNVGAEGQAVLGGFACALVGALLPASTPSLLAIPLCLAAAFAGGALVGAVPGVLKASRGAHEVIVTIMLNFVVLALLEDAGKHLYVKETVHTAAIAPAAELPLASRLFPSLHGSALSWAFPLSLLAAAATWWGLRHTVSGSRIAAVGDGREAAALFGVPVGRTVVLAMSLGGGLAGLVGANFVLGYKHYYEEGFTGGVGFLGIAVALLGRNHPAGIVAAALLFGTLAQGALVVNAVVPKELVDVLSAVIILAVAAAVAAGGRSAVRGAGGARGEAGAER